MRTNTSYSATRESRPRVFVVIRADSSSRRLYKEYPGECGSLVVTFAATLSTAPETDSAGQPRREAVTVIGRTPCPRYAHIPVHPWLTGLPSVAPAEITRVGLLQIRMSSLHTRVSVRLRRRDGTGFMFTHVEQSSGPCRGRHDSGVAFLLGDRGTGSERDGTVANHPDDITSVERALETPRQR